MSTRTNTLRRRGGRAGRTGNAMSVLAASGAVVSVAGLAFPASAAQINYGSHSGTHVTYVNVTEDTGASEPLPLFGPPTVTGDSIDFNPIGFDAASVNGGADPTVGNLSFMVLAKIGSRIDSISFAEVGDTTLGGNVPPGSMETASAVFASGTLDIHEVDFQGINHISVPFSMTFSPSGGTYFLGTDGGGGPIYNTLFTGSATLPVADILVANGFDSANGATKVSIDLVNTLQAVSQSATSAVIAKTDFGAVTTVAEVRNDIPEPTTLAFVALALSTQMRGRRRT